MTFALIRNGHDYALRFFFEAGRRIEIFAIGIQELLIVRIGRGLVAAWPRTKIPSDEICLANNACVYEPALAQAHGVRGVYGDSESDSA